DDDGEGVAVAGQQPKKEGAAAEMMMMTMMEVAAVVWRRVAEHGVVDQVDLHLL
ncbi:hypothetical protein Tco_0467340, partial [Tanacetum coccineum]